MDLLRTLMTVAAFAAFVAVVWWAYAPSRRELWRNRGELGDD